jgi:DNA repair exonuclease SbcCD ATPase subunit
MELQASNGAARGHWTIQVCPDCGPAPRAAEACPGCGRPLDAVEVVPAAELREAEEDARLLDDAIGKIETRLDAERRRTRELEQALRAAGADAD